MVETAAITLTLTPDEARLIHGLLTNCNVHATLAKALISVTEKVEAVLPKEGA